MRIVLKQEPFVTTSFDHKKIEILRILRTDKFIKHFYNLSNGGVIPLNEYEALLLKIKNFIKELFKKKVKTINYGGVVYLDEADHDVQMMSLLEKQVKLKSIGIVGEIEDTIFPVSIVDKRIYKLATEDVEDYNRELLDFISDNDGYRKLQNTKLESTLERIKYYMDSKNINENSPNADHYLNYIRSLRDREEE